MKKLLLILYFAFIGQQALSQMYMAILSTTNINANQNPSGCINDFVLVKIDPQGNISYDCLGFVTYPLNSDYTPLSNLNVALNNIINQGYKLIKITDPSISGGASNNNGGGLLNSSGENLTVGTVWYFAIPWTSSGLEEVATTLKNFIINPNPANTFVDISLDYYLKGESEVVFISEAGYISHKQSIGNISKNEKYNIDISKIPAGKYLVTIVNGKTYTTPQKLIIL